MSAGAVKYVEGALESQPERAAILGEELSTETFCSGTQSIASLLERAQDSFALVRVTKERWLVGEH